jgi:protein SCO1/2
VADPPPAAAGSVAMNLENSWVWFVAAVATFTLNLPFGGLRRGAPRHSSRWFACLAAPIFLLVGLRAVAAVPWMTALPLLLPALAGQTVGRRLAAADGEPSRSRWRTAVYATLLAGLLLLIGGPVHAAGADYRRLEVNEPAPAFSLVDQNGQKVSLRDFLGQVVALTFFYSTCIDVCPVLLGTLETVEGMLNPKEMERVRFLAVTVDASRDTTERLKTFMAQRGLNAKNWHLLTGSVLNLMGVMGAYGVVVRPGPAGDFVHNSVFIIIDGKGIERVELHGAATPAEVLLAEIRAAMR